MLQRVRNQCNRPILPSTRLSDSVLSTVRRFIGQETTDPAAAYKKEQRERLKLYVVGGTDLAGDTIEKIFVKDDEYVIYRILGTDESGAFRVMIEPEVESDPKGLIGRLEAIKGELADFRSILYKGVHDTSIRQRAANAVSTALSGDLDTARNIFKEIKRKVNKEYEDMLFGRLLYLSGAFSCVCLLSIISIVFYVCREYEFIKHIPTLKNIIYSSTFSSCGGLLSVCINLRFMQFERESKRYAYYIYGTQRIILASLGGIFTYIVITSGVFFGFILKSENPLLAIMALCVASGFSETLIPNALRKLENEDVNGRGHG